MPPRPPKILRPATFVPADDYEGQPVTFHGRIYKTYAQLEVKGGANTTLYVDILNDGEDATAFFCKFTVYGKESTTQSPTINPGEIKRVSFFFTALDRDADVKVQIYSEA